MARHAHGHVFTHLIWPARRMAWDRESA
jgi:hypothetical protein